MSRCIGKLAIVGASLFLALVCLEAYGAGSSGVRDIVWDSQELRFLELERDALQVDKRHFFYEGEDRPSPNAIIESAQGAAAGLAGIRGRALHLSAQPELGPLIEKFVAGLDRLSGLYLSAPFRSVEEFKKDYAAYLKLTAKFSKLSRDFAERYPLEPALSRDFDLNLIESSMLKTGDGETYLKAMSDLESGAYREAYRVLEKLLRRYENTPASHGLMVGMADCLLGAVFGKMPAQDPWADSDKAVAMLTRIIESKDYSPFLYQAYYRWMPVVQSRNHGASNWSEMPNGEYLKKRRQVYEILRTHLQDHPDDGWARVQVDALLEIPVISTGLAGNTAMNFLTELYS